jgi:hypothetical protein
MRFSTAHRCNVERRHWDAGEHSKSVLGQKNVGAFHVEVARFTIVFIVETLLVQDE